MPAQYDHNAHTPFRTFVHMLFSRYFFRPLYSVLRGAQVSGRENIPAEGKLVIVSNHLSNLDPPLITFTVDRPVAYLAKEELYTMRGFKEFCLFFGAISIDRDKPEKSTFKAVRDIMGKPRWALGMFIEGTRSKTPGVLGQPHTGPAYFAKANKAMIVPVGITGTNVKGGKIRTRIGKPISPSDDLDATTWEIMQSLSDLTGFALPKRGETIDQV